MTFHKSLNVLTYSAGNIQKSVICALFGIIIGFFLQTHSAQALTTTTIQAGNWGVSTNWSNGVPGTGDVAIINHLMNFNNVNINIGANAVYTFNAGAAGSSIALALSMENGSPAPILNINTNVSFAGGINLNSGTINVADGATLTVTNQINQAGTQINVAQGAYFNVTGNYTNNGGNIAVDGLVTITGDYNGQNAVATVTGGGNITTTGHMIGMNLSSIFGTQNPNCPSNCDGRNLFGGGNCGRTATAVPQSATVCAGEIVNFTTSLSGSSSGSLLYQWQYKNASGFFVNISGSASSTFSSTLSATTILRVVIGAKQNPNDAYCYTYSGNQTITVNSCTSTWTGTSGTDWGTAGNWNPAGVPTFFRDVTIPDVPNKPIINSAVSAKTVVVNSGSSLAINSGSLSVYGNLTNNGTFTAASGTSLLFKGTTAQTVSGVSTVYNATIDNTAGVSLLSPVSLTGTLTLTKGVLTTNSNLTINFGLGGDIGYAASDAGSISGTVTGTRVAGAKSHYIAAPFSGVTAAQVQAVTPLYVSPYWKLYTKDFANQNWTAVTSTATTMPLGTGYSLSLPSAAQLSFTGTYDHTFALTGATYSNTTADKYILIGNPYPATLDWSNASGWTKTNVANAIYFWDPANNRAASYVANAGINGATSRIPAMQAFMVTTTGGGGTASVSINNNARLTAQTSPYFRVASDDIIRLTLIASDTTKTDEAVIRFNEMATDTFDIDLDAHKILNSGLTPSLYTHSGTDIYSINSYPSVDSAQYIPVSTKLPVDGTYKLKIAGNNPNIDYILVDKLLGTQQRVEADSSYAFSGSRTDDVNRFELQLRVSTATVTTGVHSANMNSGLGIFSSTKGFVIKTDRYAGEEAEIEILDVMGKSIQALSGKNLSMGSTYFPLDMAEGSYLIKVNVEGNVFAGMIVLTK